MVEVQSFLSIGSSLSGTSRVEPSWRGLPSGMSSSLSLSGFEVRSPHAEAQRSVLRGCTQTLAAVPIGTAGELAP